MMENYLPEPIIKFIINEYLETKWSRYYDWVVREYNFRNHVGRKIRNQSFIKAPFFEREFTSPMNVPSWTSYEYDKLLHGIRMVYSVNSMLHHKILIANTKNHVLFNYYK